MKRVWYHTYDRKLLFEVHVSTTVSKYHQSHWIMVREHALDYLTWDWTELAIVLDLLGRGNRRDSRVWDRKKRTPLCAFCSEAGTHKKLLRAFVIRSFTSWRVALFSHNKSRDSFLDFCNNTSLLSSSNMTPTNASYTTSVGVQAFGIYCK